MSADVHSVSSLFFVYEFIAGATTLDRLFVDEATAQAVEEAQFWSIAVQVCGALRAVHSRVSGAGTRMRVRKATGCDAA